LVRPRMDDMAAGTSYGAISNTEAPKIFNGQALYWSGGGGNAKLRPWKANAYDLSLEKYFGRKGYVSAAIFYKELTSYIYSQTLAKDYTGFNLTPNQQAAAANYTLALANHNGVTTAQANGNGGHIQGLELTASLPGDLVLPALDGFGLILSAAFNESEVNPTGTQAIDLPGLSRRVINTTLFYEKHGFSARVSNRYRGDFLGEVPNFANTLENNWVHSESVVDAQIGYEFRSGPLKGLTLNLTGTNLTDEPFYTYSGKGHPEAVLKYEKFGSTYMFGMNYKFQ
jgi:iron complex outermembrane receptor protein